MQTQYPESCVAFCGSNRIATGNVRHVARAAKKALDQGAKKSILIFDDETSRPVEVDLHGTLADVVARLPEPTSKPREPVQNEAKRGPGRPKLGVVAREVTLLPQHWEWLNSQPGGASVTLRKLVTVAKKANAGKDQIRNSQNAAYGFMTVMAGDLPGFEEATRALFGANESRFKEMVKDWPKDVREHATRLAEVALKG